MIQTSNAKQNKRRNTWERDNGYSLRDQIEPLKKAFLLALENKKRTVFKKPDHCEEVQWAERVTHSHGETQVSWGRKRAGRTELRRNGIIAEVGHKEIGKNSTAKHRISPAVWRHSSLLKRNKKMTHLKEILRYFKKGGNFKLCPNYPQCLYEWHFWWINYVENKLYTAISRFTWIFHFVGFAWVQLCVWCSVLALLELDWERQYT